MVNPPPPFNKRKSGEVKKRRRARREDKTNTTGNTMVFGDNVRARMAARALPRTPTQKGRRREKREQRRQATRTTHPITPPPFCPTQTITTIPQRYNPDRKAHHVINNAVTANTLKGGMTQGEQNNTKGSRTTQCAEPNPNTGHHNTHHTRHSTRPLDERQGGH